MVDTAVNPAVAFYRIATEGITEKSMRMAKNFAPVAQGKDPTTTTGMKLY